MSSCQLSEADAGSSRQLAVGDEVTVRLAENPTTGYRWRFNQTGSGSIEQVDDQLEPPASGAPGAGGVRRVRFVARRTGSVQLEAVEQRSWEAAAPHQRRLFSFEVR